MYVPKVRERVRVKGYEEVFAVVHVDPARHCADLACLERVGFLAHVPLERIRPADEEDCRNEGAA